MSKNPICVLAMVLSLLAACGKSSDGSPDDDATGRQFPAAANSAAAGGAGEPPAVTAPTLALGSGEMVRVLKAQMALPSKLDRASFDVKARAAALGSDPRAAFDFVRDRIVTEPYPGVLRGAAGTLSAGGGNDLDKALLLGALLKEQGHEIRYAHCPLAAGDARIFVKGYFTDASARSFVDADLTTSLTRAFEEQGISQARSAELASGRAQTRAWLDAAVAQTSEADFKLVQDALARSNIKPAPVDITPTLIDEARQHYWLQLKAPNGWEDLDPSKPASLGSRPLCEANSTFETLPEELHQAITVTVRNEYLRNGRLTSSGVLTKRLLVSDHYGDVLFFSNEVVGQSEMLKAAAKRLSPVLTVGKSTTRGEEFDYDPGASASGGFDPFGSALSGGEDEPPKLVAQWLDFTIEAPGRKSLVSRAVVDAVPPRERLQGKITTIPVPDMLVLSLLPAHAIAITAGPVHSGAAMQSAYGSLDVVSAERVLEAIDQGGKAPDEDIMALATHMLGVHALKFGVASERALVKAASTSGPHLRIVRDLPMLTIAAFSLGLDSTGNANLHTTIDLRHDVARFAPAGPTYVEPAFWANVRHGLVDGAIEHHLPAIGITAASETPAWRYDTSAAIAAAKSAGVEIRASTGTDAVQLLRGDLAVAGGERLLPELGDGIAMIGPSRPLPSTAERHLGIWTVDLGTGQLYALTDSGLREVIVSYSYRVQALAALQTAISACLAIAGQNCSRLIDTWMRVAQEMFIQFYRHGV